MRPGDRDKHICRGEKVNSMKAVDVDNDFFRIQSRKVEHATHENYSATSISSEHDDGFHFPIEDYGEHGAAFLSGNFLPLREEYTSFSSADRKSDADERALRIIGSIPDEFPEGQFAYVGPNPKLEVQNYKVWGKGPDQKDFNVSTRMDLDEKQFISFVEKLKTIRNHYLAS